MEETTYTLSIDDSEGTSNVNYLLSAIGRSGGEVNIHLYDALADLTPGSFEQVFGPGDESCYDPAGGYQDPEWYWKSSDGCAWGIGWRYGKPRLRGKGDITPSKAEHFLGFLHGALETTNMTDREMA